jgi:hypothetical protein
VAPIALYPDALLGQVLVASTYPLEVIQLQQWLAKNPGLKDKALADAVAKQPWDPSIQALAALPDAVKRLSEDIAWTTSLGNAFLAQQGDVMNAVQRMRKKAQGTGALKTTEQQKVETKVVEEKTVIVVQQANPEVIYVPSYNPTVVYGPPIYAYPPIYYPPPPPVGAVMVGFTVGVMMTAAWHGGPPYGCGWGHSNTIVVNHHNTYVRHTNVNNVNNVNRGNSNWNHNPQHRGGTPYASAGTANRYGGGTASGARQQPAGARPQAGASNWSGPSASTGNWVGPSGSTSNVGARSSPSTSNLSDRPSPSTSNVGARPSPSASSANRSSSYSGGGGGDRVGSQNISSSGSSRSGFGGSSDGFSGRSANASSARGASSYGSRGGGGGSSFGSRGGGRRGR